MVVRSPPFPLPLLGTGNAGHDVVIVLIGRAPERLPLLLMSQRSTWAVRCESSMSFGGAACVARWAWPRVALPGLAGDNEIVVAPSGVAFQCSCRGLDVRRSESLGTLPNSPELRARLVGGFSAASACSRRHEEAPVSVDDRQRTARHGIGDQKKAVGG